MMATTHGFMSLAVAVVTLPVADEYVSPPLLLAVAFVGGVAPDLDVIATHRKTLHYPFVLPLCTLVLLVGFSLTSSSGLLLAAVAIGAAALHSVSDVFAGGVEAEPWKRTSEEAVYNHLLSRWHRPRRYVRYAGAPEDVLLGASFAAVALGSGVTSPTVDRLLLGVLALTGLFALSRKRLGGLSRRVVGVVPDELRRGLPSIGVDDTDEGTTLRFEK